MVLHLPQADGAVNGKFLFYVPTVLFCVPISTQSMHSVVKTSREVSLPSHLQVQLPSTNLKLENQHLHIQKYQEPNYGLLNQ